MDLQYEHLSTDKAKLFCTVSMSVFCFPAKRQTIKKYLSFGSYIRALGGTENNIDDSTVEFGWVHYIYQYIIPVPVRSRCLPQLRNFIHKIQQVEGNEDFFALVRFCPALMSQVKGSCCTLYCMSRYFVLPST